MTDETLKILLVDKGAPFAAAIYEALRKQYPGSVLMTRVRRTSEALEYLASEPADVVLLRMAGAQEEELEAMREVHRFAPELPIVVVSPHEDGDTEMRSLREGVQEFLTDADVKRDMLMRAIRHAIERQKTQGVLRNLALVDDLTGLYNRRGFLALAEHQLRLARRGQKAFALVFSDLDGLKSINDTFGHHEGSRAIQEAAEIFRQSFRASDVLSRVGGDEFCALMLDATARAADLVKARLLVGLRGRNAGPAARFVLSMSTGVLCCDAADARSLEEMLAAADSLMYRAKRARLGSSGATRVS